MKKLKVSGSGTAASKLMGLFKKGPSNIGSQFGDALISGSAFKKKTKAKRVKAK